MRSAIDGHDRSIGELFGQLASETSTLVRQEVKLAATEMGSKVSFAARQLALVGVAALVALLAAAALLAGAVIALADVMPTWAAALTVGGGLALVAAIVGGKGIAALRHLELTPTQTLLSLEENKSWAKKQIQ